MSAVVRDDCSVIALETVALPTYPAAQAAAVALRGEVTEAIFRAGVRRLRHRKNALT